MYARTIEIGASGDPVTTDVLPVGFYMLRAGYDPSGVNKYGAINIYFAPRYVDANSPNHLLLDPGEAINLMIDAENTVFYIVRDASTAIKLLISEV